MAPSSTDSGNCFVSAQLPESDYCLSHDNQYNDIEMLELVGTGYAMANAAPGVADHADAVTSSVEDVLEKILLDVNL